MDCGELEVALENGEYPENTVAVVEGCVVTVDLEASRIEIVEG